MKHRTLVCIVLSSIVFAMALACATRAAPPYSITQAASRNLVPSAGPLVIRPVVFHGAISHGGRLVPEPEWLQGRTPEQLAAWNEDQAALPRHFMAGLQQGLRELSMPGYQPTFSDAPPPAGSIAAEFRAVSLTGAFLDVDATISDANGVAEQVHFQVAAQGVGTGVKVRNGYGNLGLGFARYLHDRIAAR